MTPSSKAQLGTSGSQRRKRELKPENDRKTARSKPSRSPSPSPSLTRKGFFAGVVALAVGLILWLNGFRNGLGQYKSTAVNWDNRRGEVKEAFICSWDAYAKYAWGSLSMFLH